MGETLIEQPSTNVAVKSINAKGILMKTKVNILKNIGALVGIGLTCAVEAATFNPILGNGYNSDRTMPTNQSCFTGNIIEQGPETGFFSFDSKIDISSIYRKLNVTSEGKFTFKKFSASNEIKFLKEVTDNSLQINFVYKASYTARDAVFNITGLSDTGQALQNNSAGWRLSCGDGYISKHSRGAELYAALRFKFHDKETKENFQNNVSADIWGFADLKNNIDYLTEEYSSSATIELVAYQIGGYPSALAQILQTDEGEIPILDCSFKNRDACKQAIEEIVGYSANEFSDGAQENPSMIGYDWYDSIYNGVHYPIDLNISVPSAVIARRDQIADRLDELELDLQKTLSLTEYWNTRLNPTQLANIANVRARILRNIDLINDAGYSCYDSVDSCINYSDSLLAQQETYQKSSIYFPAPLYLDISTNRVVTDQRGTNSTAVEVNCPIPSSASFGGALTGIAAGVGSAVIRRIRIYYRPILTNGTLGDEYFTDCGSTSQQLERTLRAPNGRVIVSYGVRVSDNTVSGIRAEACPLDPYDGRIAVEECAMIGNDNEAWYSPTNHGLEKSSTIIRSVGLNDQQDNIEVIRTGTIQLREKPTSDLQIAHSVGLDKGYRNSASGEVSYSLNLRNFGPASAENIIVKSFFPEEVYFVSANGISSECSGVSGVMTCAIDIIDSQTLDEILVTLATESTAKFSVESEISAPDSHDPNLSNNFVSSEIGGRCVAGCGGSCPEGTTSISDPTFPSVAIASFFVIFYRNRKHKASFPKNM